MVSLPPLSAVHQDVAQHVGAVGHQAVDPEVEQVGASRRARRRSTRAPGGPRRAPGRTKPRGDDGRPPRPRRCGTWSASPRPRSSRRPGAAARTGSARPRPGRTTSRPAGRPARRNARSRRLGERPDARPGRGRRCARRGRRAAGTAASDLRSMLKRVRGKCSSRSAIRGIGSRPPIRASAQVDVRQRRRCVPVLVGDPVEDVVVEGQQHAVAGEVHVGLEVAVAELHGVLERVQGVLQAREVGVVRAAAVRERQHRRPSSRPASRNGKPVCGRVTRAVSTAMRPRWPRIAAARIRVRYSPAWRGTGRACAEYRRTWPTTPR